MMPHALALAVEIVTTVLTIAGILYFLLAMVAARAFSSFANASCRTSPLVSAS